MWATSLFILNKIRSHMSIYSANVGARRFVQGLYKALFSLRLARLHVIYKAKRK